MTDNGAALERLVRRSRRTGPDQPRARWRIPCTIAFRRISRVRNSRREFLAIPAHGIASDVLKELAQELPSARRRSQVPAERRQHRISDDGRHEAADEADDSMPYPRPIRAPRQR